MTTVDDQSYQGVRTSLFNMTMKGADLKFMVTCTHLMKEIYWDNKHLGRRMCHFVYHLMTIVDGYAPVS